MQKELQSCGNNKRQPDTFIEPFEEEPALTLQQLQQTPSAIASIKKTLIANAFSSVTLYEKTLKSQRPSPIYHIVSTRIMSLAVNKDGFKKITNTLDRRLMIPSHTYSAFRKYSRPLTFSTSGCVTR